MLHKNFLDSNDKNLIDEMSFEEKFEYFWILYPKKVWKKPSYNKFKKVKDFKNLFIWLRQYKEKWKIEETPKQYIPNPETFLNQERYYDEIIIYEKRKELNKKLIQEKKDEKEKIKKEQEWNDVKIELIKIYNSYTPDFRKKIKDEAIEIVKKQNPTLIWTFFDTMVNITIRKIIFERFYEQTIW